MAADTLRAARLRGALYLSGVLAVALNSLVFWPWLGHVLDVGDLAAVVGIATTSALIAPVVLAGLHAFALRTLAGGDEEERRFAYAAVPWAVLLAAVTAAAGWALVGIGHQLPGVVAVWTGMTSAALIASAALRGVDAPRSFALHALISQSGALACLGLLSVTGVGLDRALLVTASALLVPSLAVALYVARWDHLLESLRRAAKFSVPLVPHLVLAVGLVQVIKLLVVAVGSSQDVAAFQFAALVAGGATTVVQGFSSHLTTDALRAHGGAEFDAALQRAHESLYLLSGAGLAAMGLFVWTLLPAWLPDQVDQQAVVIGLALMAPSVLLQVIGDVGSAGLMKVARTSLVSLATGIGALAGTFGFGAASLVGLSPVVAGAMGVLVGLAGRATVAAACLRRYSAIRWAPQPVVVFFTLTALLLFVTYILK